MNVMNLAQIETYRWRLSTKIVLSLSVTLCHWGSKEYYITCSGPALLGKYKLKASPTTAYIIPQRAGCLGSNLGKQLVWLCCVLQGNQWLLQGAWTMNHDFLWHLFYCPLEQALSHPAPSFIEWFTQWSEKEKMTSSQGMSWPLWQWLDFSWMPAPASFSGSNVLSSCCVRETSMLTLNS